MRKISLIILGLVALVRAFPNPQDEDLAILADIAGKTKGPILYLIFCHCHSVIVNLDTGHFFHTSLPQCLVFLGIHLGQESKI